ncbi:MAG: glyoxalase [Lachnospiraceae bacterium]|nr:glyoxalase [Lachnospiraceae bacterium]
MSIMGLSCIFPVPNIKKTAEFYVSKLEFRAAEYLECKEPHICLYKDNIEIILLQANTDKVLPNRKLYGYGYDAYLYTENQELLEKEFIAKGIKIIKPLNMTDYQNKELVVEDLDGRWLAFGLKVKN